MLHKRNTAALDRVGDEHLGLVVDTSKFVKDPHHLSEVVAAAARNMPSESPEFCFQITQVADLTYELIRLQLVVIDDDREIGEFLIDRTLKRFVDLSFLQLSVTRHHKNSSAPAALSFRKSKALAF